MYSLLGRPLLLRPLTAVILAVVFVAPTAFAQKAHLVMPLNLSHSHKTSGGGSQSDGETGEGQDTDEGIKIAFTGPNVLDFGVGDYVDFSFDSHLTISGGDINRDEIVWILSSALPQGLIFDSTIGALSGVLASSFEADVVVNATYKGKSAQGVYQFKEPSKGFYVVGGTVFCEDVTPGDKGEAGGQKYIAVPNGAFAQLAFHTNRVWNAPEELACTSHWDDMSRLPSNGVNLGIWETKIDHWDVSNVKSMDYMFENVQINKDLGIAKWDVSSVKSMVAMFKGGSMNVNHSIGQWDVSNVESMESTFEGMNNFLIPLNAWNVSKVKSMKNTFKNNKSVDQPLSNWNVSNVETMESMFEGAQNFKQDIGSWDVSSVRVMDSMLEGAKAFNQNIGSWNVSNVVSMSRFLHQADNFNQNLAGWCVTNIESSPWVGDLTLSWTANGRATKEPIWGTCPSRD